MCSSEAVVRGAIVGVVVEVGRSWCCAETRCLGGEIFRAAGRRAIERV